jgi:signal transduction histidine kinase/Flp pilus assembly protein TadD
MKAILAWFLFGFVHLGFAEQDPKSVTHLRAALAQAKENHAKQAEILLLLGKAYREEGKFDSALFCLQQAATAFEADEKTKQWAESLDEIAMVHEMMGHFDKALDFNQQVLKLHEQQNDSLGLAITYNNLGIVYSNLGNFEAARSYYKKSLGYSHSANALAQRANAINNIAISYYYESNYEAALLHYRLALQVRKQLANATKISESYHNLADVFLDQDLLDSAYYYYSRAYTIADSLHNSYMKVYSLYGLATTFERTNRLRTSIAYAQHAWAIARELAILREQSIVSEFLYTVYKKQNRYDSALYFFEQHKQVSDSLFNIDKAKAIASLEARAQLERKELELVNQHRISKQQRYALYSLGAALLASLAAALLYNKARKKERADRKIVEEQNTEIQRQADALEQAGRSKDKLMAIIGHDLRGPIGSLKGLLELVSTGQLSAQEFAQLSARLNSSVDNLFVLVNHLLQWANTQLKGIKPQPRVLDLSVLAKENVELLNVIALKKNISLINKVPDGSSAWADANLVNVVLRNLISNALKYTPAQGTVTVRAQANASFVSVTIEDTGLGMDAETVAKLFSGSLTSTPGTSGEKGTGLGLSLCQDFVNQQGGTLTVSSTIGVGSAFTFTLPLELRTST